MKEVQESRFGAQSLSAQTSLAQPIANTGSLNQGLWTNQLLHSHLEKPAFMLPEQVTAQLRLPSQPRQIWDCLRHYALTHAGDPSLGLAGNKMIYVYYQPSQEKITLFTGCSQEYAVVKQTATCTFAALVVDEAWEFTLRPGTEGEKDRAVSMQRKAACDLLVQAPDDFSRPRKFFAVLYFNVYRQGISGTANCNLKTEWVAQSPPAAEQSPAAGQLAPSVRPDYWSLSRDTVI